MHVHIIDHKSVHLPLISHLATDCLPSIKTITFSKTDDDHSPYIEAADLVILSGGKRLVHLNPGTHRRLARRIVSSGKPIFGICLGAEALAHYFGADLVHLPERISGVHNVELVNDQFAPELQDRSLPVYQHHRWSIVNQTDELVVDAKSEHGIELFHHTSLPIWGSQFHPEARREGNQGFKLFQAAMRELGFETKA